MSKTTRSRRHQTGFGEKIRQQSWLLIPLGILAVVGALAVVNGRRPAPSGVVESFLVDTPGDPLPPQPKDAVLPGKAIPLLEAKHIPPGETATYNSIPPTSGAHYEVPAEWGIHDTAPKDESLVHNLEHGGIVISYNPEQIQGQTLKQLQEQAVELSKINPRVVLVPRDKLEGAIALTAWGYLQQINSYDMAAVKAFYDAHIARGPECKDGQCPG